VPNSEAKAQIESLLRHKHHCFGACQSKPSPSAFRAIAIVLNTLEPISASPDPDDDFILATAVTGKADALVTGDTAHVLLLQKIKQVRIMTARAFLELLEPPQKPSTKK
jgi:hypothetical protein